MVYSASDMPKIIWMFWHDWADAPEIAKSSVLSWRIRNPDWDLRNLSWSNVEEWLDVEIVARICRLDIDIQHKSDLLRLELLYRHGGVWADSTSFCAWPLSDWITDCMAEGFFAFRRDVEETPDRPIANWFLASTAESNFTAHLYQCVWQYWSNRSKTDEYFWFHRVFTETLERNEEFATAWARVPALSCIHPFHFSPNSPQLAAAPTAKHLQLLVDPPSPVYKLTHKLSSHCGPNSLFQKIIATTTVPFTQRPVHSRIILHVGLPKSASTTLQTWADSNRDILKIAGVFYPPPSLHSPVPKHQDLVSAFLKARFDLADPLVAPISENILFLSAEGLTNHFYDLERDAWASMRMRSLFRNCQLTLLMITRDKQSWLRSYHQQQVKNPPNITYLHGTCLHFADFVEEPRVKRLANWETLLADMKTFYRAENVVIADLGSDWAKTVTDCLGVPHLAQSLRDFPRQNEGLSNAAIELLRQTNAFDLGGGRKFLLWHLNATNRTHIIFPELIATGQATDVPSISCEDQLRLQQVLQQIQATTDEERDLLVAINANLDATATYKEVHS